MAIWSEVICLSLSSVYEANSEHLLLVKHDALQQIFNIKINTL